MYMEGTSGIERPNIMGIISLETDLHRWRSWFFSGLCSSINPGTILDDMDY